jgi:3D (Asp-Asp-Asp) domain-containing protein
MGVGLLFGTNIFGAEQMLLARVTGYWRAEGCGRIASWNGERLQAGHCAVDPKRIPFGSKVIFPDTECVAVDTGPAVVSRKSARFCGRTTAEKKAIVVDRFFETKQEAVTWSNAHPRFMMLRVVTPDDQALPQSPPALTVANSTQVSSGRRSLKAPSRINAKSPPVEHPAFRRAPLQVPLVPLKERVVVRNPLNGLGR